ncbi:MAG: AAA family ATPase [Prevotella sp.]|jgi:hypothetical protein
MKANIDNIRLGGFANLQDISLSLNKLSALVAPNNYGKSNVLKAIVFGFDFIQASPAEKRTMMTRKRWMPINTSMSGAPFSFEISGTVVGKVPMQFCYGFQFEWARADSQGGSVIVSEHLRMKALGDAKYRLFISRNDSKEGLFLPTETGRCTKPLALEGNMLALNKLANYDDLFYVEELRMINSISVKSINTLENPDDYFTMTLSDADASGYSIAFPQPSQIGFFVNSLKRLDPNRYELLRNTVMDLLPNMEEFEPVQIDMRGNAVKDVPYQVPSIFYDIRVKERYNNQTTSISSVSTGCKKIVLLLVMLIAADVNQVPLLMFEELENSVHPKLLQNILTTVAELAGETKVIITSHSPFLIKYLSAENILIGVPSDNGIADFRKIKPNKVGKLMRIASSEEVSFGEYLFDLMLDMDDSQQLVKEYLK